MSDKSTNWLHFSDIHTGIQGQPQLWPRFQHIFMKDLEKTQRKAGPFDFIVFSGDLVQAGSADEFGQFDEILGRIIETVARFQKQPPLITVPGNHDLVRPKANSAYTKAFARFWTDNDLRRDLWTSSGQEYIDFLHTTLQNYTDWRDRSIKSGIHAAPVSSGPLPGDSSYVVAGQKSRIGLAALNSTWLQLGGSDYRGHLHVDTRQLTGITNGDPDTWVSSNDVNLLVTHHPVSWLHSNQPDHWNGDIYPAGRFDAHLFGHMHAAQASTTTIGGGTSRQGIQAASLLGLATYADGKHERIQGYSANRIELSGATRALTIWPRALIQLSDGQGKIVPDSTQDIDEETGSLCVTYALSRQTETTGASKASLSSDDNLPIDLSTELVDLSTLRYQGLSTGAHKNIRRVELNACLNALKATRAIWISADWGLGEEGFLSALRDELGGAGSPIFRIDGSSYTDRQSFIDGITNVYGFSFAQLCDSLSDYGQCLLVIQNVSLAQNGAYDDALRRDIEDIAALIIDYAPNVGVIINPTHPVRESTFYSLRLRPLDEADVCTYIKDSSLGTERYSKPDAVSIIFNHTDGVPTRIDDALRTLELCSLDELRSSNLDIGTAVVTRVDVPSALKIAIEALKDSDQKIRQRSYELLMALSSLPQGERLQRLKRFLGPHPFLLDHAKELHDRSLIDSIQLPSLDGSLEPSTEKSLVVSRPVREYVRSLMDATTAQSFDDAALVLYFGDDWRSGDIINSPTGRRVSKALCDGYEIQNAIVLALRNLRRSYSDGCQSLQPAALRLAVGLVKMLDKGDHYRSVVSFSEDVLRVLDDGNADENQRLFFEYKLATSLRMVGRTAEAKSALLALNMNLLNKSRKETATSELALTYESLNENSDAALTAQKLIRMAKRGSSSLQARAVIAEQIHDSDERVSELEKILIDARRKNANITTNNILMSLCDERGIADARKIEMLREIIVGAEKSSDHYNLARAIVRLTKIGGGVSMLSDKESRQLVAAYRYSYSERFSELFNRCHDGLWKLLVRRNDLAGLLELFRHSSFIWRLNERDDLETEYGQKLLTLFDGAIERAISLAVRNGTYFSVRVAVVSQTLQLDVASPASAPS